MELTTSAKPQGTTACRIAQSSAANGLEFVRCQFENAGRVRTGRVLDRSDFQPCKTKMTEHQGYSRMV